MNRTIAHGTLVLIVFIAAITIFTADAHAQSPYLPTGSWTNPVLAPNCNNLSGFDTNMICYTTTVRCPDPSNPGHNLDDLSLTVGY